MIRAIFDLSPMRITASGALLMLFVTVPVYADFMVLKKKILVGKFQNSTDTAYRFDAGSGVREVPKYQVSRLVIGYDGIPVCFQTRRSNTPNCKGSLFLLDKVRAVMAFQQKGKDEWYLIRMRLSSLTFLRMKKSVLDPALMPVIASGVQMRVFLDDDEETVGELLRARGNMLELRRPDGSKERLKRGDIKGAEILLPGRQLKIIPDPPKRLKWWWFSSLIPSLQDFRLSWGLAGQGPGRSERIRFAVFQGDRSGGDS